MNHLAHCQDQLSEAANRKNTETASWKVYTQVAGRDGSSLSPLDIARVRTAWVNSSLASQDKLTYHFASTLSQLPIPDRARERVQLSEAVHLLSALQYGPVHHAKLTPDQAFERLHLLARSADGEQVRAEALEVLMRWGRDSKIRERAHEMLWTELPQTPPARRLNFFPAHADWLQRGLAAFKARDYQLTLGALYHYTPLGQEASALLPREISSATKPLTSSPMNSDRVQSALPSSRVHLDLKYSMAETRQRAALMVAISLMRLRVYPKEAERQLNRAVQGPDHQTQLSAIYYQAHLFNRMKRWDESIAQMRHYIREGPQGRRRREARYQIGRTLHQAGRYDEAIVAHKQFLETRPRDRAMYEWFLGWSYFRKGDCKNATRVWREISSNSNLIVGPKALYWIARCHAKNGRKRSALRTLKKLFKNAPLGYYALLAQKLGAQLRKRSFKWRNPLRKDRKRHWRAAALPVPKRSIKKLKSHRKIRHLGDQVRQALQLVSIGEEGLARIQSRELCDGQASKLIKRRLGKKRLYRLCDALLFYTGDHGKRWKRQASRRIGWRTQIAQHKPQVRAEAYPLAYYDLSTAAAEVENISPWWLMAHMFQESRYRPEVVSHAQAIGLMQILGRTGKRIHERMNWPHGPFFSDQLYDPALSIRYAAWYLRRLSDDLGHPLLAIGAYNGGPMRFADHQDQFQGQPFDVMVEEIGAHESRNYLRKVADHFIRYLALYASDQEWERWTQQLIPPDITPTARRIVGF